MPADLPLSVWPTANKAPGCQRSGRYIPESGAHPGRMLPAIAARAIATYTAPGDLVVDPMCGIGTTLVEAIHLGRAAIGVEYERRWAIIAKKNIKWARKQGATGEATVIVGDARKACNAVDQSVIGTAALVLTSPPYGSSTHGCVRARPGCGVAKSNEHYSNDRDNLAHVGHDRLLAATSAILVECARLLRPGGIIAMTVRPYREKGRLVDLPGEIGALAGESGLVLFERNVALLAGLKGEEIVPRASFFALEQARRARKAGEPRLIAAHEDLLVFRLR